MGRGGSHSHAQNKSVAKKKLDPAYQLRVQVSGLIEPIEAFRKSCRLRSSIKGFLCWGLVLDRDGALVWVLTCCFLFLLGYHVFESMWNVILCFTRASTLYVG